MGENRESAEPTNRSVDRENYAPAYLSLIANALSWGGARIFLREFGVGTNEWRVLSAVLNYPGCTATFAGNVLGLNKAVVSRSVKTLEEHGLIVIERAAGRRELAVTAAGLEAHDRMMEIAVAREEILFTGFSEAERSQFLDFLRRMHDNVPAMNSYDPGSDA